MWKYWRFSSSLSHTCKCILYIIISTIIMLMLFLLLLSLVGWWSQPIIHIMKRGWTHPRGHSWLHAHFECESSWIPWSFDLSRTCTCWCHLILLGYCRREVQLSQGNLYNRVYIIKWDWWVQEVGIMGFFLTGNPAKWRFIAWKIIEEGGSCSIAMFDFQSVPLSYLRLWPVLRFSFIWIP